MSVHGVLSGTAGYWQRPVVGLHPRSLVHSLLSDGQVVVMWVWMHWPCSQPAWVQALVSVSVHGVLSPLF